MGGVKAGYDCIKAFSETDFTEDLKKFDVPTLILHGDDDQIVPIGAAALLSSKIVKGATLKVYTGFPARHAYHPGGPDQRRPAGVHRAEACESSSMMKTLPGTFASSAYVPAVFTKKSSASHDDVARLGVVVRLSIKTET